MKKATRSTFILLLTLAACDFGDTNINPSAQLDAEANNILPATLTQSARNAGSVGARVTGIVMDMLNGVDAQPEGYSRYVLDETVLDDFWRSGLYGGAMKDCAIIIEKAQTQNIPHYRGIAKVLMAYNLGTATAFWGDVPYSESFRGIQNLKPKYDKQEEIYNTIQRLLDEAMIDFGRQAGDLSPGTDDLVYGGNISSWLATARALKARYYMHLTLRDPQASARALAILATGSIFSNTVQPDFDFDSNTQSLTGANPLASFIQDRADQIQLGTYLATRMVQLSDPRLSFYGSRSGEAYQLRATHRWTNNAAPLPLISYSEVKFIEAEARLRTGDETRAQTALRAAITANMDKVGVTSTSYSDYVNINGTLTGLPNFEAKLARIIEQKYIAMYGHSMMETWTDYRRTGYPNITPRSSADASFFEAGTVMIPRRYLYPQSERNTNPDHYNEAIVGQGGHKLDIDLWAFKK